MIEKEMTREQLIALIASDYGFGPERTNNLTTEILKSVCNASQPNIYLGSLLEFPTPDIYIDKKK